MDVDDVPAPPAMTQATTLPEEADPRAGVRKNCVFPDWMHRTSPGFPEWAKARNALSQQPEVATPERRQCYLCKSPNHLVRHCPVRRKQRKHKFPIVFCIICGSPSGAVICRSCLPKGSN
ncbi:unnamed protein product [Orchesella dallaii]|uniref:CCHC-type domain-containing protein n=1 Tax=Orchesella dallaii TaxID=48710 RepID=A0ABP1RP22_9HEXA